MAKGSLFWSTAKGKLGDMVIYTKNGETIARKYQPQISNPKTNAQMLQRAKFAACVSFYQHSQAQYYRYAYEDKSGNESNFNAFMRHNIKRCGYMLRTQAVSSNYPAIGLDWEISGGSLRSPEYVSGDNASYYLSLPSADGNAQTIGALSAALVTDYNLQEGDIITIITISSTVSTLAQAIPSIPPVWDIKQFLLDTTSTQTLDTISTRLSLSTSKGLYLDNTNHSTAYWYGVVFSRNTANGLLVSTSQLKGNSAALSLYYQSLTEAWRSQVLTSWAATGDAILQGSLVSRSAAATITTVGGDDLPRISSTTLGAGVSSSATLIGTGLTNLTAASFGGVGIIITNYAATSDTEAVITITGTGEHPNSWILTYGSTVLAQHADVQAQITAVSPSVINSLTKGDTALITITGNYVDALKPSDFVSSSANLVVQSVASQDDKTTYLTIAATDAVDSATISYSGSVIVTVKVGVAIKINVTTPATLANGANDLTLTGTGLDQLTAASFSKPSGWIITTYNPSSDGTSATMAITVSGEGSISYGSTIIAEYSNTVQGE